ncbi:hypothetical protein [Persephonella sp. KM09-Lau-8]|uniref:hypothetical protein n=1 Tax=Persephonella sp. KM09-Lau-8 TaxID=1158345 RepID=UPI0004956189|nr:hypothetical protein [Persephonella sp. KM09-Lau-8]
MRKLFFSAVVSSFLVLNSFGGNDTVLGSEGQQGHVVSQVSVPLSKEVEKKTSKNPIPVIIKLEGTECSTLVAQMVVDADLKALLLRPYKVICKNNVRSVRGVIVFSDNSKMKPFLSCSDTSCSLEQETNIVLIETDKG